MFSYLYTVCLVCLKTTEYFVGILQVLRLEFQMFRVFEILNFHPSILLKEPFALKNSETVYFTNTFSTPSYSDIAPIDNFDLTFFYFYFVFEVFDTIQF